MASFSGRHSFIQAISLTLSLRCLAQAAAWHFGESEAQATPEMTSPITFREAEAKDNT